MPLEYMVYTPPCYQSNSDHYYPVLYLLHGYGYNNDQWYRLGVTSIMDRLINLGEISPFILVMPLEQDDISPPPENLFGEAILYDLVGTIDSNYRTLTDRKHRAIGGLSRGGNWAIHLGLSQWEFFGLVGAHSASLFIDDGPPKIQDWLEDIPGEEYPRILLDIGEKDKWLDHIFNLEELLDAYDVPHELIIFPGGHTEAYWGAHTELYIRWYAQDWD